jgi:ubiquinone/menaquinone biosynthesis C-methylase UbiE
MNNFDTVAPFYDRLSSLVFGRSIRYAQTIYLHKIPREAKVLIVGGGTGWILRELLMLNPKCQVWYVEASHKMMELAKGKAKNFRNQITFIHGTENSIPANITFDSVITPFYLDLFSKGNCALAIQKIRSSLHTHGIWIAIDFVNTTWWHGVMLSFMYLFFRLTCSIEAMTLPNWRRIMSENGFLEIESKSFYRGFIKSVRFRGKFSDT